MGEAYLLSCNFLSDEKKKQYDRAGFISFLYNIIYYII